MLVKNDCQIVVFFDNLKQQFKIIKKQNYQTQQLTLKHY